MTIDQIKKWIIDKYGLDQTVCYYYYLWNVVDYCGEERVRQSFESIKGQGNEIIVGDYGSTDDTKKIAKEYGFKVLSVEPTEEHMFAESKVRNKIILESKSNFLVPLNINVEYGKDIDKYIKQWLKRNSVITKALRIRTTIAPRNVYYGFSTVFYKPYLLYARGYDERTTYSGGSQAYGAKLLKNVFNIRVIPVDLGLIHKQHNQFKRPMMSILFPDFTYKQVRIASKSRVITLINELQLNLKNIKNVENSYW